MDDKKTDMKTIVQNDYESLKKGTISSDKAFRVFSVFQAMHRLDETGKVRKALLNFYSELKKQYPDVAAFMVGEDKK